MMMNNQGKYITGSVKDFETNKGWFFGHFSSEPLLQSNDVEVAWQNISNKTASPQDKHLHTNSVEINIVIAGKATFKINNTTVTVAAGEFYVIWPNSVVSDFETETNTQIIVVRAPGVNDKVVIE